MSLANLTSFVENLSTHLAITLASEVVLSDSYENCSTHPKVGSCWDVWTQLPQG